MSKLLELKELGQSIWLDYIRRAFITSGELQDLVDQGLGGITASPALFAKAIAGSRDYDHDLAAAQEANLGPAAVYERLALDDVRQACAVLRPVHEASGGTDGYAGIGLEPALADDAEATLAEARRLAAMVGEPNLMIMIPATAAGCQALTRLTAEGIKVNLTLVFSPAQYERAAQAYLAGLEERAAAGGDLGAALSVVSFSLSRIDTRVDPLLAAAPELQGRLAVALAKTAHARMGEIFSGPRWQALADKGGRNQRLLWASTSTKNPAYSETLYVEPLMGPQTINALPKGTLRTFLARGRVAPTLEQGLDQARADLERARGLGIDLELIGEALQAEGVAELAQAQQGLLTAIADKRDRLASGEKALAANLGPMQEAVDEALVQLRDQSVLGRIWSHDHTVWKPKPDEIVNRLGWLDIADRMEENLPRLTAFADRVRDQGITQVLLLGMGGSSLCPEVFSRVFGARPGYPDLAVLDSTDPAAVLAWDQRLDYAQTLFVVSTKSGGTVETLSFFKYFFSRAAEALGREAAGAHFVAITDPGSGLADLAREYDFGEVFLNDPEIGGRYSALSYFGLVPAALLGMDLDRLLSRALIASANSASCNCPVSGDNRGARLGALLGEAALMGRDKVTILCSPSIAPFGDWVEQLIAESTGKEGRGILPVVGETVGRPEAYGDDRVFVYLRLEREYMHDAAILALEQAGHPVCWLRLEDAYDLGGQFFLWEFATVVAGQRLGINPFDQPNVESAKKRAKEMVAAYQEKGSLPTLEPTLEADGIAVVGETQAATPAKALLEFVEAGRTGDYICLQAFIPPTEAAEEALHGLRARLRDHTRLAATGAFGPRFLHSTGQLHKGDAGGGLFIQFTAEHPRDAAIPETAGEEGSVISFGVLIHAQALGDRQALIDAGRRVIRFHLGVEAAADLARLLEGVS